ncbi:MAG: rod shape-determining protein MreC [Desulfuromonadales bacterium GWD2_61_12]|nr:MAG: rod shape-determining protein MreC [Desulfuromonadales bacterium GWC2_61_20]OGR34156.1 MAG: rod shape-determining protein MreC [Desulfuromonadales bacterium GWD2_61_12]HAD03446.1 rod shape-determining protein MreC [Desulfuromonas sp.]HBT83463.1 rod shape-determining protein MreC [Desulfuromonas sp.]
MFELLRKYRTLFLLALLFFVALSFYSFQLRRRDTTNAGERQVLGLLFPMQQGVSRGSSFLGSLFGGSADAEEFLAAENRRLRAELIGQEELRRENERLKGLLAFRDQAAVPTVAARVIGVDATNWFQTVTIDKGSSDGVSEGAVVVNDQGAVGRVVRNASRSSRVLLITDASSAVATLVERTRSRGICQGTGAGLILDYVALPEDVVVGDVIVTSGLGGIFPKGLPVGVVVSVVRGGFSMFQTIQVAPAVDFARLEEVLVLSGAGSPP